MIITRTGPARAFIAPLTIQACIETTHSSKWAVEYGMRGSGLLRSPGYVLRSTPEDLQAREAMRHGRSPSCYGHGDAKISVTMPNSTPDEIQSGEVVTTTSAAVIIPVAVDRGQVSNFETYYQTLGNSLRITVETPRSEDDSVDPDDPSVGVPPSWAPEFGDDEEPWVPWEKKPESERPRKSWGTYSGKVPVFVRSIGEVTLPQRCHHAQDMWGQIVVILFGETKCEQNYSSIHYLDEDARGPIFVDPSAIRKFLAEDPAQRGLRAPLLGPVVSSPPEGEELVYRYHHHPHKPPIYVGETWVKKVAKKGERKVSGALPTPTNSVIHGCVALDR